MDGPVILVPVFAVAFGIPCVLAPLAKASARRIEHGVSGGGGVDPALQERMNNMERNIDVIAVEIEKLAEGQRFVTKLLAERERPSGVLPPSRD